MAFFGLTALGPQNAFEVNSTTYRYIQVFNGKDFRDAWVKVNGPDALHIHRPRFPLVFKALFHGPVPANEQGLISEAFENGVFETRETISLDSYLKVMVRLREEADEERRARERPPNTIFEFNSTSEMSLAIKKNAAMKHEIITNLTAPLCRFPSFFVFVFEHDGLLVYFTKK